MNCIKERCKYCREHDFYSSYYTCSLFDTSYNKEAIVTCKVFKKIDLLRQKVDILNEYTKFIEHNQMGQYKTEALTKLDSGKDLTK